MRYNFKIVVEKIHGVSGYSVFVPALPGCASQGETMKEALSNIKEALGLFLETLLEDGQSIPPSDAEVLIKNVQVSV